MVDTDSMHSETSKRQRRKSSFNNSKSIENLDLSFDLKQKRFNLETIISGELL
jgi:hypothetical protein